MPVHFAGAIILLSGVALNTLLCKNYPWQFHTNHTESYHAFEQLFFVCFAHRVLTTVEPAYNNLSHQRPPVSKDHFFLARAIFNTNHTVNKDHLPNPTKDLFFLSLSGHLTCLQWPSPSFRPFKLSFSVPKTVFLFTPNQNKARSIPFSHHFKYKITF